MTACQKVIAIPIDSCIMFCVWGISAVGAHHTGSVGVTGSNPVCSTKLIILIVLGYEQVLGSKEPAELAEQ